MNSLLLANNIRLTVATQIRGLGTTKLPILFSWEPLSFGWTLSDVVCSTNKSIQEEEDEEEEPKEVEKESKKKVDEPEQVKEEKVEDKKDDESQPPTVEDDNDDETEEKELSGFAKAAKEAPGAGITLGESLLLNDNVGG